MKKPAKRKAKKPRRVVLAKLTPEDFLRVYGYRFSDNTKAIRLVAEVLK